MPVTRQSTLSDKVLYLAVSKYVPVQHHPATAGAAIRPGSVVGCSSGANQCGGTPEAPPEKPGEPDAQDQAEVGTKGPRKKERDCRGLEEASTAQVRCVILLGRVIAGDHPPQVHRLHAREVALLQLTVESLMAAKPPS